MKINSRNKGKGGELELIELLRLWTGIRFIRNLEQSRSGGCDLIVHPAEVGQVADLFRGLAIECKRSKAVTPGLIKDWWCQAKTQANDDGNLRPVLAYREDRKEWKVVVPLNLIDRDLTKNLSLHYTATISVMGLCHIISEASNGTI